MESTKHPDQNPEEAPMLYQEENSQQEKAVNTVKESSSPVVTAEAETEVVEKPAQTEAVSEPEKVSETEVVS